MLSMAPTLGFEILLTKLPSPPQQIDADFAGEADAFVASFPGIRTGVNSIISALSLPCSFVSALPAVPSRGSDPVNFGSESATFLAALPTFRTEINAFIAALNAYDPATYTAPGLTDVGPLLEITVSSGSVTLPAYSAGDVCFIHLFSVDAGGTAEPTTPPTGWSLVSKVNGPPPSSHVVSNMVFRRVMDGTEGTSIAMTFSSGPSKMVRAITVHGANTGGALTEGVATASGQATGTGTINLVGPNVTTSGANRLLLNFLGTCRGVDDTAAGTADAWTDVYQTPSSTILSLNPDIAASYQNAAGAGTYTGETRTKQQVGSGDILWAALAFAVIMA